MNKNSQNGQIAENEVQEFVIVCFAENMEQARDYEILLQNDAIPVIVKEPREPSEIDEGVAVMVPESSLDEAHVVIESQSAYDDFYDYITESEDGDDFVHELFDDEF